jgi:hypothetical protein
MKLRPNLRAPWTPLNVPEPEKQEVLGVFAAHKKEVTQGYNDAKSG